jgi:YfiH family protein
VASVPRAVHVLQVAEWRDVPRLVHGFCGRRGGVSRGPFAELNLSRRVGDDPAAVVENWRRVQALVGARVRFASMRQVHGARVATVTAAAADVGEADAMATETPAIVLGVLTADCVPILLLEPARRIVAAVHAGWRGTLAGLAARTVTHLQRTFGVAPPALRIALGPAIDGCCYEVEAGIAAQFEERWGVMPEATRAGLRGKAFLDLRAANAAMLAAAGVPARQVVRVGPCTRCADTRFFSHRGAHGETGRQISFIGWDL